MPSSHLILCRPLFLLSPIPPSIRVFSKQRQSRCAAGRARALGVGLGGRGDSSGFWLLQVTVWEALTNTRPGVHHAQATAYEEQLQLER